ncbi:MAG: hypothetical protein HUJ55_02435 [Ileibacterium sp.]|nr:hypothetical protein [Ileibacterium sp.]
MVRIKLRKKGLLFLLSAAILSGCSMAKEPINRQWDGNQNPIEVLTMADKNAQALKNWHSVRVGDYASKAVTEETGRVESWFTMDGNGTLYEYSEYEDHSARLARYTLMGFEDQYRHGSRLQAQKAMEVFVDEDGFVTMIQKEDQPATPALPLISPDLISDSNTYTVLDNTPSVYSLTIESPVFKLLEPEDSNPFVQLVINKNGLLSDLILRESSSFSTSQMRMVFDKFNIPALDVQKMAGILDEAEGGDLLIQQKIGRNFFLK